MTAEPAVYTDGQGDHWQDTGHTQNGQPVLLLLDGTGVTYPRDQVELIWPPLRRITTQESP
jgi:hypothetical protein